VKRRSPEMEMADAFHSSAKWQRTRAAYLQKHPLCEPCLRLNKVEAAVEVDHIVPVSKGGPPTLAINLQSVCKPCHIAKTAAEQAGMDWRKHELRGCDEHGMPIDPEHAWSKGNGN
jgi:5-methylcytosine-specific restriction protein A